jgi:hypothetical protein
MSLEHSLHGDINVNVNEPKNVILAIRNHYVHSKVKRMMKGIKRVCISVKL